MLLLRLPDIRAPHFFLAVSVLTALLFAPAAPAQQEKYSIGINVSKGSDNAQDLYEVVVATQDLLNTLGRFQRVDPILISTLNSQLTAIKYMTPEEEAAISKIDLSFADLSRQIEELTRLLNEQQTGSELTDYDLQFSTATSTSAFGLKIFPECENNLRYNEGFVESWVAFAQGPCGLESQGLSGNDRLTDAGFPLVCPVSTRASILVVGRVSVALAKTAQSFFEKLCFQSVFGNNTSTACIITDVIWLVLNRVFTYLDGCNGKRGDAEGFINYARAADLFVSNKNNFSQQNTAMETTLEKIGQAETDLNSDVSDARAKIEEAGDVSKILADLVDLETKAIQNSQELDRVLVEQRAIMEELGIEHLYQDPNTSQSSGNLFNAVSGSIGKDETDTSRQSRLPGVDRKGESR
jgi:hypothetical protein